MLVLGVTVGFDDMILMTAAAAAELRAEEVET